MRHHVTACQTGCKKNKKKKENREVLDMREKVALGIRGLLSEACSIMHSLEYCSSMSPCQCQVQDNQHSWAGDLD